MPYLRISRNGFVLYYIRREYNFLCTIKYKNYDLILKILTIQ